MSEVGLEDWERVGKKRRPAIYAGKGRVVGMSKYAEKGQTLDPKHYTKSRSRTEESNKGLVRA
jgi:hypothetical protein